MAAERTLLFMHIPKTAGSTLNDIFERNFHRSRILSWYRRKGLGPEEFDKLRPEDLLPFDLIRGHFTIGIHERLDGPSAYVTFLRHPERLVLSRKDHRGVRARQVTAGNVRGSVRSYISDEADNIQTRYIANYHGEEVTEDVFNAALDVLGRRLVFVGITELFDESLLLMRELLPLRHVHYIKRNTNNRRRTVLAADERQLIGERYGFDLKLYEVARQRLLRMVEERQPEFDERLRGFRRELSDVSAFSRLYSRLRYDTGRCADYLRYALWRARLRGDSNAHSA